MSSTVLISDHNGRAGERLEYDAYGVCYNGALSKGENIGFNGKKWDPKTEMYDYGFREYSPFRKQWLTEDPVRSGTNWYGYCGAASINRIDLWGLCEDNKGTIQIPPPGWDPTKSPGEGWEWRGKPGSNPGDKDGQWHKPTGESLRPDLDHPEGVPPHWDYIPGKGKDKIRIDPDTGKPLPGELKSITGKTLSQEQIQGVLDIGKIATVGVGGFILYKLADRALSIFNFGFIIIPPTLIPNAFPDS